MESKENSKMEDTMENKYIPMTSISSGIGQSVLPDIYYLPIQIVNIIFVGSTEDPDGWVLIDTGMPRSADRIVEAAEERFGKGCRPKAIMLTHGHFDHVGAVIDLVQKWNVPVYAHTLELPYLTGKLDYPEPDGTVEGGLIAKMSPLFPNKAIDLGNRVQPLPSDGSVPEMPDWRWIHTPGHSPGQVSFFRDQDKVLVAGDAFVTVRQDSLYKVLTQKQELCGPPRYLTTDWKAAWASVKKLEALEPNIAITGHGLPMFKPELTLRLKDLVENFEQVAIPDHGKYVEEFL
jgi:glyoxylase-like metal-dependent hydrolase (beta-lactamase superfamily II)